jgi:hypothetical protein
MQAPSFARGLFYFQSKSEATVKQPENIPYGFAEIK